MRNLNWETVDVMGYLWKHLERGKNESGHVYLMLDFPGMMEKERQKEKVMKGDNIVNVKYTCANTIYTP